MTTINRDTLSPIVMDRLREELPSFFTRAEAAKHLGGILTKKTIDGLSRRKDGPPIHYVGRKALFIKEDFLAWMERYFGGMQVEHQGYTRVLRIKKGEEV